MPAVHLTIKGKVQGVFYRAKAKEKADHLGIKGWVKNTADGNVEALAQGTEESVQQYIEWCRLGPDRAEVAEVIVETIEDENYDEFNIVK